MLSYYPPARNEIENKIKMNEELEFLRLEKALNEAFRKDKRPEQLILDESERFCENMNNDKMYRYEIKRLIRYCRK